MARGRVLKAQLAVLPRNTANSQNTMENLGRETLLTSHQVGSLLQINPSSVVKWVNDGLLQAYRTPGGHRRIKTTDLLGFLRGHGMYVPQALRAVGPTRVLLIDDNATFLSSFARAMKSHKHLVELTTVDNGIEGLLLIGSTRPDAVLIDLRMPDLDGIEVCERIKNNPLTKATEVLMYSGAPTPELEKKVRAAGAHALLAKPFTAANVVELLTGAPKFPKNRD